MQEMQETQVQALGREDALAKEMATHSRILAWKIPWIEDPGRLQSMGSQSWTWHTHTHVRLEAWRIDGRSGWEPLHLGREPESEQWEEKWSQEKAQDRLIKSV